MQEAQNSAGDAELARVAQKCANSSEKHIFVVGPPRSGKSTRLPIILAALGGMKVISAQPDDWVARYYADWIRKSTTAGTYDGKRPSVGYYSDTTEMKADFVPEYDVSFVSYRWLYRMVAGVNPSEAPIDRLGDVDRDGQEKAALTAQRQAIGDSVGYVVLDELHAQSVAQELGYIAVHAATSGVVQVPMGFFEGTRVIVTTAYPDNDTFVNCFGLSNEEIGRRTIGIERGLLALIPSSPIQEVYLPEDAGKPSEYHNDAKRKSRDILRENKKARVLLLMDTKDSLRNVARSLEGISIKTTTVLDLETQEGRDAMSTTKPGDQLLVLATASFASRIPIEGITDVICPCSKLEPVVDGDMHRQVLRRVYVARWALAWAKSHLDPACENPRIHYMFRQSLCPHLPPKSDAAFRAGGLDRCPPRNDQTMPGTCFRRAVTHEIQNWEYDRK
ncbi:hypothetical protein GGR55DRAFT_386955 [Xylaria sp. FL0064]|nr:hypothetical protein GGR55DRAFT_386955 [Xylaria sp. FL0064]